MRRFRLYVLLGVSLVAFAIYLSAHGLLGNQEIKSKGEASTTTPDITIQYLSLATGVASLLTAIVGLVRDLRKKILETDDAPRT
jgi:hypothetical protein